jgi:hypothetical protein
MLAVFFSGCTLFKKRGSIQTPAATVVGVADAGKPASLASSEKRATLPIPAGSSVLVTKTEAVRAIPATEAAPGVQAQPAREVIEIKPSRDTQLVVNETKVDANTGTVDTTVAAHRIDTESSQPLLYCAIGAIALAIAFEVWLHYRTPAICSAGAAVIFFAMWKSSSLPPWFWAVAVASLFLGAGIYFGHERGEKTAAPAPAPTPPAPSATP